MPTSSTSSSERPASRCGDGLALALCLLLGCGNRSTSPTPPGIVIAQPVLDAAPPPPAAMRCVAGGSRADFNPYEQTRTVDGDNGTFTDACDAHGNLVSYQCANQDIRCPGGGGRERHMERPCFQQTGQVEPAAVDCDGQCHAGACAVRCPQAGDHLTFVAVDARGNPTFDSAEDPRRFACTLAYDQNDSYDCASAPRAGDTFTVAGLGMSSFACTGGVWGAISDARCTYADCHFVYGP